MCKICSLSSLAWFHQYMSSVRDSLSFLFVRFVCFVTFVPYTHRTKHTLWIYKIYIFFNIYIELYIIYIYKRPMTRPIAFTFWQVLRLLLRLACFLQTLLLCPPPFCALICYSFSFHTPSYQFLSVICCSLRFARLKKKRKKKYCIFVILMYRHAQETIKYLWFYTIINIYCTIYKTYSNNYLLARRVQNKKKITLVLKTFWLLCKNFARFAAILKL